MIDVNFTSVVPRQCDPEEDYYDWVPTDERPGGRCLLGEVVTHERRNSSVCCFVDPAYEKLTNRTQCTCAIEDFEWWVLYFCFRQACLGARQKQCSK